MRILLDACVPVALKRNFVSLGHECQTVREAGFADKKNGELLTLAERRWDVLLTTDRKIEYQQHMLGERLGSWFSVRRRTDYRIFYLFCQPARKRCSQSDPDR